MQMAKATERDLKASLDLAGVLEDIEEGHYPRNPAKAVSENGEEPTFFDQDDPKHLRALFDRLKFCLDASPGGLFRVAFGMSTVLDPSNEIVDPNVDHLALHPRIEAALATKQQVDASNLHEMPKSRFTHPEYGAMFDRVQTNQYAAMQVEALAQKMVAVDSDFTQRYCEACEKSVPGPCSSVDCSMPDVTAQPVPVDGPLAGGVLSTFEQNSYDILRTTLGLSENVGLLDVLSLALLRIRRLTAEAQPLPDPFQDRVRSWMIACFGAEISVDTLERNHRFLEEALELVQACGATQSEAHQLVDYVFGRPIGNKTQEVGGVMVTLAALCTAQQIGMLKSGEIELARIWTMTDVIRAKQAAKPKDSPLPIAPSPDASIHAK